MPSIIDVILPFSSILMSLLGSMQKKKMMLSRVNFPGSMVPP